MLTIAVSSRSLFHMEDENALFEAQDQVAYDEYMRKTEDMPLPPGAAFSLVRKLLSLNTTTSPEPPDRVEVVLLSRNSANAGVRVMRSAMHYGLNIEQAVFTGGGDRFAYALAMKADLFLCSNAADAQKALENGIAAAHIVPAPHMPDLTDTTVRIAFDGDSVLFSDEADLIYRTHGLKQFRSDELRDAQKPLGDGPFKRLFGKLCALQHELGPDSGRVKTGLVTARGKTNHGRPISTLRSWGLTVDVAIFADGRPKGPFLKAFGADMFFDDTGKHVESAAEHAVPAGHVISGQGGIINTAPEVAAVE